MDQLVQLIKISRTKPTQLKAKAKELYRGLVKNQWESDAVAKQALFGDSPHKSIYYANTKRDLAAALINEMICSPPDFERSDIQRAGDYCYKKSAIVRLLLFRGARSAAIVEAEKVFKKSVDYGFTEVSLSMAKVLRKHFAEINPNRKKFEFFKAESTRLQSLLAAEDLAERLYSELVYGFSNSKAFDQEIAEKGEGYVQQLQPVLSEHQSFRLHYTANNLMVTIYLVKRDHQKVIQTCRSALRFFEANASTWSSAIFSFHFKMIPSFIQLKKFQQAKETINVCLGLSPEGNHNWIITEQYEAMLGFYSGDYELSYQTIKTVKKKIKIGRHLQEQWLIYEAYAEFLIGEELSGRTFRLSKFLNEIPTFSNDKRGMNINLLIIQTLFLLKRGKRGRIIDQAEALRRYTYRHLKPGDTFRSNCFIKMLLLLPACHFNLVALKRKSADLWAKLQSVPIDLARQDHDLEVVPYEVLWEKVLELLRNKTF